MEWMVQGLRVLKMWMMHELRWMFVSRLQFSHTFRQSQGKNKGKSIVIELDFESNEDDSDDETFVEKFI